MKMEEVETQFAKLYAHGKNYKGKESNKGGTKHHSDTTIDDTRGCQLDREASKCKRRQYEFKAKEEAIKEIKATIA